MSRLIPRSGLAAAAIFVLAITAPTAAASTPSPTTLTLTESGIVTLAADHFGSVEIWADDVILDCAGHHIVGPSSGTVSGGLEILGGSRVTVRNCLVTGFEINGVFGYGSQIRLEHNTIVGNGNNGIHLDSVSEAVLADNTVRDNGTNGPSIGIAVTASEFVTIESNAVSGQGWAGIALLNWTWQSLVRDNTTTGNYFGILVQDGSNDNAVRGNTANRNTHGIALLASRRNLIDGNAANGNINEGFGVDWASRANTFTGNTANGNGDGFDLRDATANTLSGNIANRNSETGFRTWLGASANTLYGNTALNNGWLDAYEEDGSLGNTWDGNVFRTTNF